MKKSLSLLLSFLLLISPISGVGISEGRADTTLAVTVGSGVTLVATDDGSGNLILHSIPCDRTTPTQCININPAGAMAIQPPATLPLPSGASTGAKQDTGNTSLGNIDTSTAASALVAGAKTDAKSTATDGTSITFMQVLKQISASIQTVATWTGSAISVATHAVTQSGTWNFGQTSQYPVGATPYTASATGTTGATTATLVGASSVTTYICGFSIRANATAATTGNATVTGVITATFNFTQWTAPNASGLGINEQIFAPCIPASATNTSIAVVSAAPGTGGVVSVTAWGYKL